MAATEKKHIGRKIERIRILKDIKQETLAIGLGLSQSAISRLEQSEDIDSEKLERIAEILGVDVETIKNFNEESAVNIISNAFHDNSILNGLLLNPTFNPIDSLWKLFEANKSLYERMLETERSKVSLLEDLLKAYQAADKKKA